MADWKLFFSTLLSAIASRSREEAVVSAQASDRFLLYKVLSHSSPTMDILVEKVPKVTLYELRWFFRLRCELLWLNYTPWLERPIVMCSLCNSRAREDVFHFVAECTILVELRLLYMGCRSLTRPQLITILNGTTIQPIVQFARHAWAYRYQLVQAFNF